jgi:cell wall-associated NlpC family hydrolase
MNLLEDTILINEEDLLKRISTLLLMLTLGTASLSAAGKTIKHTIKKGDSLYEIAHKNHTSVTKLREINHLKKGETLKIGKVLKVPTTSKSKKKSITLAKKSKKTTIQKYKISSGDSLYSIAHKNHTTVLKLRELNHLKKNETLKIGKVLKVPTTSKSKKKSVTLAKKSKKHSIKTHTATKKHTEKKLAKALKGIKSKKLSNVKKSNKFALSDIIFSKKSRSSVKGKKLIALAKKKLGRRYVWGATGQRNTFDCSGLTTYVCKKNGIKIPRRAIEQSKYGKYVSRKNLKPGDLIFFDTSKRRRGYVNHVGIYIGNNKFIHASSAKHKVIITSLSKPFYNKRFKLARRVAS